MRNLVTILLLFLSPTAVVLVDGFSSSSSSSNNNNGAIRIRLAPTKSMAVTTTTTTIPPTTATTSTTRLYSQNTNKNRKRDRLRSTLRRISPLSYADSFVEQQETVSEVSVIIPQTKQETKTKNKKSAVSSTTFNLIKAIVGSGVLSLPSGLAAMSDSPKMVLPAVGLLTVLGALSAYTFMLYGRLFHSTPQAQSLGDIWIKEKGESSAWIISTVNGLFCLLGSLAYTIMLGDVFQQLSMAAGFNGLLTSRPFLIMGLSLTTLLPLCSLQSLAALAPLSITGVIGVLVTIGFVGWRCPAINAASPYLAGTGQLLPSLFAVPKFNTYSKGLFSPSALVLVGMAATSFLGHFSAPQFYHSVSSATDDNNDNNNQNNQDGNTSQLPPLQELNSQEGSFESSIAIQQQKQDPTPNPQVMRDFLKVTLGGFSAVTIMNCLLLSLGFLTFGGSSSGVLLNNYSVLDTGATICRLLMALCVIGGYPFLISAFKKDFFHLFKRWDHSVKADRTLTKICLATLVGISLVMKNAGFVIGFTGALMGCSMIFIFPSMLFLSQTAKQIKADKNNNNGVSKIKGLLRLERWFCRFLIGFGVVSAVAGASVSVLASYFPHVL